VGIIWGLLSGIPQVRHLRTHAFRLRLPQVGHLRTINSGGKCSLVNAQLLFLFCT
jgi:hypothetical protein